MNNPAETKLHQLLLSDSKHLVAECRDGQYQLPQFLLHVFQAVENLQTRSEQSYLLFARNTYDFSVNFVALLLLQKDIVLTANHKAEWLDSISHAFQVILSDNFIDGHIASDHYRQNSSIEANFSVPPVFNSRIQFYTSGSSSEPKAVVKTLDQLLLETATLEQLFGQSVAQTQFFATVSHHHIYGLIFRLLWPLLYRHPFCADMILYPEELIDRYQSHSNICLISSPAFLSRHDKSLTNIELKQCFSSGSLLSNLSAKQTAQQFGIYPTEVFGSTETGGIGYRTQEKGNTRWSLFPGVTIETDTTNRGILYSPYLNQPHPLDDLIELDGDRHFHLLGRVDRVVKIEEKRLSLDALETTLKTSSLVNEAKVVVIQDKRTFIGAVIELSAEGQEFMLSHSKHKLNEELKSKLINTFEAVAIPRKWRYFERLPYNSEGKLPLSSLTALF